MVYIPPPRDVPEVGVDGLYDQPPTVDAARRIEPEYPVFPRIEKLMLGLLRPHFEPLGVTVLDQHNEDINTPLLIVRSSRAGGATADIPQDVRFLRSSRVVISALSKGVDGDDTCSELLEAVQQVLFSAVNNGTTVPGAGHIAGIGQFSEPVRVTDFATATNIVQYASLPDGHVRYEQTFALLFRPPRDHSNRFLLP